MPKNNLFKRLGLEFIKMKEIETRDDIFILVKNFYAKIQKNEMLSPIFNSHIAKDEWPAHLDKLTDFWVTNLFGEHCFRGNPTKKHMIVDKNLNYKVRQEHFGKWLELWFETIDSMFEGEKAFRAKNSARKMATGQYLAIWHQRPKSVK